MTHQAGEYGTRRRALMLLGLIGTLLAPSLGSGAQGGSAPIRRVRLIKTRKLGVPGPEGLAFSPRANAFVVLAERRDSLSDLRLIGPFNEAVGAARIQEGVADPLNMAFDAKGGRLLILRSAEGPLVQIAAGHDGRPVPSGMARVDVRSFGLQDPRGMALDPATGHLFILDAALPQILRVQPDAKGRFDSPALSVISLEGLGGVALRGLAFDPTTGHLHVLSPSSKTLYEVTDSGDLVATRDLSAVGLHDPQGMTFAPSGDTTDDPAQMSLYVADAGRPVVGAGASSPTAAGSSGATTSGGGIVELTLAAAAVTQAASTFQSSIVTTTLTSQWSPPAPDPSDVVYLPASNTLRVVDSEVDEMTIWAGANEWETTLDGFVLGTSNLTTFTNEPTGISVNPANRHLFYSDDTKKKVFEIDPGADGQYHTSDDVIRSFSTSAFGSGDPEDVTYDPLEGVIYLADGVNAEVYRITPGANGLFDGIPPAGDDLVTHFDTSSFVLDPECLTVNTDTNHLYIGGNNDNTVQEITTSGALVQSIDISAANAKNIGGIGFGPGSGDPTARRLYLVQRGVDNDSNPSENDGKLWEMALPASGPAVNTAPVVNAGLDQTITLPASATLNGTVTDDGLPNPPGAVTTTWSKVSGPGTVAFANPNTPATTASFSTSGTYVLRLTADDSALSSSDDVTITVFPQGTVERRIAAGSDDVEERVNGRVSRTSVDLELVYSTEGSVTGNQTVALRFTSLTIPQGATIQNAYVQLETDEATSEVTTLTIQGQAADNAPGFTSTTASVSSRPRTSASTSWSPSAWTLVGEQGPNQRTTGIAPVIQEIVSRPGWASGNALVLIITGTGKRVARAYEGTAAGAALLHVEYTTSGSPVNQAPAVNAGLDQAITLPALATLNGTVTDDGLPNAPGAVTTTWSQVSGPGTVTFADASAVSTTASFSAAGTYVLRLTASDSALSSSDELTITVNSSGPVNQAPVVNAGPDQTITLPASATLNGSVTDDGLPSPPAAVTTTWSKVSGPGTVTFGNASAVSTTASFDTAGTYVLRLTANDSALSSSDDVTITVNAAGQATLSVVKKGAIHDATDASAYSFAPITASDNRLYIVFLSTSIGTGTAPSATSVSGAGLTFTEIGAPGGFVYSGGNGVRRMQAWRALVSSGATTGSIAISLDATSSGMDAVLLEFSGMDTSGTNGSGAVVQSANNKASSATSLTVTLSAFGSSSNRPVVFFNHRVTEATMEKSGYTELDDGSHGSPSAGAECEWHASTSDTTPSASWTTAGDVGGFAIEVKAGL